MYSKWFLILVIGSILCLGGCETLKGAKDGFKKDWEQAKTWDDWMQDSLW